MYSFKAKTVLMTAEIIEEEAAEMVEAAEEMEEEAYAHGVLSLAIPF